jgi:hypothetical protein
MIKHIKTLALGLGIALGLGGAALASPAGLAASTPDRATPSTADSALEPVWYGHRCGPYGCPRAFYHYNPWRPHHGYYNYHGYRPGPFGYWHRPAPHYGVPYHGGWHGGVRVHTPGVDVKVGW